MRKDDISKAASAMGRKGGSVKGASKRRQVDYHALGAKGGRPSAREKKPCESCDAFGVKTLTSHRSHYQVIGGIRVRVETRPVCLHCDREARAYPIEKV